MVLKSMGHGIRTGPRSKVKVDMWLVGHSQDLKRIGEVCLLIIPVQLSMKSPEWEAEHWDSRLTVTVCSVGS